MLQALLQILRDLALFWKGLAITILLVVSDAQAGGRLIGVNGHLPAAVVLLTASIDMSMNRKSSMSRILVPNNSLAVVLSFAASFFFLYAMLCESCRKHQSFWHRSHHAVMSGCNVPWLLASIAERRGLLLGGSSCMLACAGLLCVAMLLMGHPVADAVETRGHVLVVCSLIASAATCARLAVEPFAPWLKAVFHYLLGLNGIVFLGLSVYYSPTLTWRMTKADHAPDDHMNIMILHMFVAVGALALMIVFIVGASYRHSREGRKESNEGDPEEKLPVTADSL
mmetsp:Transcript_115619/g.258505  ORF Transcript_115619/g.258505 Transcript_115619/m.258505 type:complete len:283 (-) Transcript_115619:7-855(-)